MNNDVVNILNLTRKEINHIKDKLLNKIDNETIHFNTETFTLPNKRITILAESFCKDNNQYKTTMKSGNKLDYNYIFINGESMNNLQGKITPCLKLIKIINIL